MESQEIHSLSARQCNNGNEHHRVGDFPLASTFNDSSHAESHVHPSNQYVYPSQFNLSQIPFQPTFSFNPMNDLQTPIFQELYGSSPSLENQFNASMPCADKEAFTVSKKSKKDSSTSKGSRQSSYGSSGNSNRYWTIEEDVSLTKSYLYVSVDSIIGKDQSSSKLWDRILKVWRDHMGTYNEKRGSNSLSCRWNTIQMAVSKFHALYESLERAPRSGTNIEDTKKEALNMYRELEDGTSFKFEHCWEIMKDNPKWCSAQLTKTGSSKKPKVATSNAVKNPPPTTPTMPEISSLHETDHINIDCAPTEKPAVDDDVGLLRPLGRKGSKEKIRRMNEQKAVIDVLNNFQCTLEKQHIISQQSLELRQQMLAKELELKEKALKLKEEVEVRKQKAEKRKEQENVMNTDLNNLQPALRVAYEKMQIQIMKEWEEEGLFGCASTNDEVQM